MIGKFNTAVPFVDGQGMLLRAAGEWTTDIGLTAATLRHDGTTAQRPTTGLWIGRVYYDTTLNMPIWVNAVTPSVVWKDAAGNTV